MSTFSTVCVSSLFAIVSGVGGGTVGSGLFLLAQEYATSPLPYTPEANLIVLLMAELRVKRLNDGVADDD